ncbi:MAG: PEP-CTERM sorting domain-containing protein [Pseudomonadota bacterium]
MKIKQSRLAWLLASSALFASHAMADELIMNGNFETSGADVYDIQGWNSVEAGAFGSVLLENDTLTDASGRNTFGPASGVNYALLDAFTISNQALYQTFTASAFNATTSSATLSFSLFVNNQSSNGTQIHATGLDYTSADSFEANQHVRVDLLNAGASIFSTSSADIAQSFYLGGSTGNSVIGGDVANGYTNYSFDLSSLLAAGGTYTLRFASVANEGQLQLGIDNVSLQVAAVPEADTSAMLLAGFAVMGFVARRRKLA